MPKSSKFIERKLALARMGGMSLAFARRHEANDPEWPKPRRITDRIVGYLEADVERWLKTRPVGGGKMPTLLDRPTKAKRRVASC